MNKILPVIVGFGGYNSSGRSSFHQGFKRTVIESLTEVDRTNTIVSLACLMGLVSWKDKEVVSWQDKKVCILARQKGSYLRKKRGSYP